MHFEKILNSMKLDKPHQYIPDFHLELEGDGWRVFDGDRAMARFYPQFLDIWAFSPFEPDEIANPEPPGKVVDLHTVHNTFLNFGMQEWPKHWAGLPLTWTWMKTSGSELEALVSLATPEGETCQWRLTLVYDPAWGRYRYQFAVDARKMDHDGFAAGGDQRPRRGPHRFLVERHQRTQVNHFGVDA
ncbi:MAG: hypothetical protein WCP55_20885, partial [Lentisphaerota bacterium]